ncbi:MAG: hypothetical protein EOM53_04325 [Alphaproteobacteria bacterium]|nr:hypothetical protein [Alphaproteobacteria bacterium]
MEKLKINLEYCYGIKKLEQEFVFSNRTFAIYAPNGVMKTSFAKTFNDYSKGDLTKDLAFPDRKTVRKISADDNDVKPENIFVIEPYDADYKSEKISTLLANKDLKQKYENAHREIDKAKDDLFKELRLLSGFKKDNIEKEISLAFNGDFFNILIDLDSEVEKGIASSLSKIKYQSIFDPKVVEFLNTSTFKKDIQKYIEKYDELIEKSPYLNKDFKFHNAEIIQQNLADNKFFKGGHSINICNGAKETKYNNDKDIIDLFEKEKNKIFNDAELEKIFTDIGKKLSNEKLRSFREYLLDNKEILQELSDLDKLKKDLWKAYFVEQKKAYKDLVEKYKSGQIKIKELIEEAKNEKTDWEEVIRIFNTRFSHLPFHLNIKNKEDVILKNDVETIEFIFRDLDGEKLFEKKEDLLSILSTGEQRALYILNIIFEVEARKKEVSETLFIIDDIADSFDYKNKYAIIEYLKYMSEIDNFYMMILSHNFDFFRTIQSRRVSTYKQSLIALKNTSGIKLEPIKYLKNPFINNWKSDLNDNKKLIASIPFIRNIIEYTQGMDNDNYRLLTSVLHYKDNTNTLILKNIKETFESNIQGINFPNNNNKKVIDLIFETADECLIADEGINLENKIVLSIAIRLKAEKFMSEKITDNVFLSKLGTKQNWKLLKKYEEEYNNEKSHIEILKRVNLITPENIHVNSFMYEPILDMGDGELRELYKLVKSDLN